MLSMKDHADMTGILRPEDDDSYTSYVLFVKNTIM